jgi:PhzF family phenazine biosynthesis protein
MGSPADTDRLPDLYFVDVFASGPLCGNGLAVFVPTDGWPAAAMQRLTQEMKQFESIFLSELSSEGACARVFTVEEELPFAGHPVLGAAAVLHRTQAADADEASWRLRLPAGEVKVTTRNMGSHYRAEMNQGAAVFGRTLSDGELAPILARLGLVPGDRVETLPAQVVSTGLPYLIVALRPEALAQAAIAARDLEDLLSAVGAKFVLVLDAAGRELRTWDNLGRVEDVATGSAAGPVAAYLVRQGLADPTQPLSIAQGRFAGRPSRIDVRVDADGGIAVSGEVWAVAHGHLDASLLAALRSS